MLKIKPDKNILSFEFQKQEYNIKREHVSAINLFWNRKTTPSTRAIELVVLGSKIYFWPYDIGEHDHAERDYNKLLTAWKSWMEE
jgi:hypothetical protein